ncbi:MAG: serine protease [Anaerolineae bacterium]
MSNNLWNRIQQATKGKKYLHVPLDQQEALQSDRSYLRIFIAEMFLESTFAWFKTWYPAVSVGVQLKFGDQPATVVTRVVRPPEDATKDGVLRNYEILPLTPFNGGTVEVQAALLAMQGADYLGAVIDVLQDFSSLVAAPLGQVLAVADKVANGLDTIMQATNGDARLPYHDTFVGAGMGANELKPGYLAIVRAEASVVDPALLSVKDGKLLYAASPRATPEPFRLADYVLLRIDGPSSRDDYRELSSIDTPYQDFLSALEKLDLEAGVTAERAIKTAILRSPDLARFDRPRVWDAISKEIADIKQSFGITTKGASPRNLDKVVAHRALPLAQIESLGDFDEPELPEAPLPSKETSARSTKAVDASPPDQVDSSRDAVDDILHFVDSGPTVGEIRDGQRVIYGVDDRKDLYEVSADKAVQADADSVVSLWSESDLIDNRDGTFSLRTMSFQLGYELCDDEPFAQQPIGAFCSGVLVAPDIIATAGHCINTPKHPVESVRFVFGFRMANANDAVQRINASEVYRGVKLLGWHYDSDGTDWAVVRLDRPVTNHPVARLRRHGKIADGARVHVIGHPCGLPAKYAPGSEVRDNTPGIYFVANLDTYGGNSGSPVFNSDTREVEGLLVRGATDFVKRGDCYVSNVCPQIDGTSTCKGEDVTRATLFSDLVP